MRSPSQALLWSGLKLSWTALLTEWVGVVVVILLLDLALDPETDTRSSLETAELVIIIGLVFLYTTVLNRMQNTGRNYSALGFPFRHEFTYPIATSTLSFVPIFFVCCLSLLAVLVPASIVNILILNVEVSYIPIGFTVLQYTVVLVLLCWWTRNGLASMLGWLIAFYLYAYGYLVPDFSRVDSSWVFEVESASEYAVPSLISAGLMVLTFFGVRRQRCGEDLVGLGEKTSPGSETPILRNLLPISASPCPTESALHAELWKEMQLNGGYRAVIAGLGGAGIILGVLSIINFFVPGDHNIVASNVAVLSAAIYFSACIGLTMNVCGVRYVNGVSVVSVFDKTTPLGTARQTLIRVTVCLSSTLVAGLVLIGVIWALGPFLIPEFASIRAQALESLIAFAQIGLLGTMLRITLILLAFLTGLLLFALFLNWFMLQSKKMTAIMIALSSYGFLVILGIMAISNNSELNENLQAIARGHLWLVIVLLPAGIVFMLRELLSDWVLSSKQLINLLALGAAMQGLNLIWLFGTENYAVLSLNIANTTIAYLIMQGFLPLLAMVLVLWTNNRIRHG